MTKMRNVFAVLSLAPLAMTQISCDTLECGTGTIEKDGVCVIADGARPTNTEYCGTGTSYDDNEGGCVADFEERLCDTLTTIEESRDGVKVCVGTGGTSCNLPCPTPMPGRMTLCGEIRDVETDASIGPSGTGELCVRGSPTASGPCSLQIDFFDALQFAQNPTGTNPIMGGNVQLNDCGQFVASDIPPPALEFIAIGADDNENGSNDDYALAGVALPAAPNLLVRDITTYVVRKSTDAAWTSSAGNPLPGGQSFVDRGVYVPIFLHKDNPVSGVVVLEADAPQTDEDYYFSDTSPTSRTTVDPGQTSTGANGSALLVDSELVMHSGQGSEGMLEGCEWPSDLADAIPGVAFVQVRRSLDPANSEACE